MKKIKTQCAQCLWRDLCCDEDKKTCEESCEDYSPVDETGFMDDVELRQKFYAEWNTYISGDKD